MPGLFAGLFEKRALDITNVPEAVWRSNAIALSNAGINVTPESALRSMAVFACVRVLAESEAMLPLLFYRRVGEARVRADQHPLFEILKTQPNPEMSAFNFRSTITGHSVLRGNG